jgi:hypothetical protein
LPVVAGEIAPAFEAGFKEGSRHLFLFQATASATMLDRKTLNEFYYGKLSKLRYLSMKIKRGIFIPANKVSSHREWGRVKRA